jgi:hypothetical protein
VATNGSMARMTTGHPATFVAFKRRRDVQQLFAVGLMV